MSSSIEEQFQPPEWATKEEVIKAACHYINYWKIEARQRNQQWLDAMDANARLKAEVDAIKAWDAKEPYPSTLYQRMAEDNARLKAEVERLTDENVTLRMERMQDETGKRITYADYASLKAEVERLRASSFVTAVPVEHYARVVKAGDIIARIIAPPAHGPGEWDGEWYAWHNAKSGVLSAETPPNTPPPAL